jgi:antitoxin HigA-1
MSVEFWMGIQTHYEIEKAKMSLGNKLDTEVKLFAPA